MTKEIIKKPGDFYEHGETVISNYDHEINNSVAEEIKNKPTYAQYAGLDFCGYVWWQDEQWHCEVWVYHSHQETFSADTLEEIMSLVSNKYGYQ